MDSILQVILDREIFRNELTSAEKAIKILYQEKDRIIDQYEELKVKIRRSINPDSFFILSKISGKKNVRDILIKNCPSVATVHKLVAEIDREESLINDKFASLVQMIAQRRDYIHEKLELIDRTELIMNVLKYKMYEMKYESKKNMDQLYVEKQKFKHACDKDLSEMQISMKMAEINRAIQEEQKNIEEQMNSLKQQRMTVQMEYEDISTALETDFREFLELYENLLQTVHSEKENATKSEVELIDEKTEALVEEFRLSVEYFNRIQAKGWKEVPSEEKLAEKLEEKGLKITKEGLLMTKSGRLLTIDEAQSEKYLEGVDIDVQKLIEETHTTESESSESVDRKSTISFSLMDSEDVQYLKENLGKVLTLALAEITEVQPRDPIHYLGHWLFKYRYNQEVDEIQKVDINALTEERERLAKERWKQFLEEEARAAVMEMIVRAEEQAMANELKRIAEEMAALAEEEEHLEDEARDVLGEYTGPPIAKLD